VYCPNCGASNAPWLIQKFICSDKWKYYQSEWWGKDHSFSISEGNELSQVIWYHIGTIRAIKKPPCKVNATVIYDTDEVEEARHPETLLYLFENGKVKECISLFSLGDHFHADIPQYDWGSIRVSYRKRTPYWREFKTVVRYTIEVTKYDLVILVGEEG